MKKKGTGKDLQVKRNIILILLTSVGIILFWRGIWEVSSKLFSSEISLMIGLAILVSIALIEKRQLFKYLK